jgi:hypothetical protein
VNRPPTLPHGVRPRLAPRVSWEAAFIVAAFAAHLIFQLHATACHGNTDSRILLGHRLPFAASADPRQEH